MGSLPKSARILAPPRENCEILKINTPEPHKAFPFWLPTFLRSYGPPPSSWCSKQTFKTDKVMACAVHLNYIAEGQLPSHKMISSETGCHSEINISMSCLLERLDYPTLDAPHVLLSSHWSDVLTALETTCSAMAASSQLTNPYHFIRFKSGMADASWNPPYLNWVSPFIWAMEEPPVPVQVMAQIFGRTLNLFMTTLTNTLMATSQNLWRTIPKLLNLSLYTAQASSITMSAGVGV